jgi:hypothetical protein
MSYLFDGPRSGAERVSRKAEPGRRKRTSDFPQARWDGPLQWTSLPMTKREDPGGTRCLTERNRPGNVNRVAPDRPERV